MSGRGAPRRARAQGRPNAFALCNYAGYADALGSGNFSAYLSSTDPSRFGDWARCRGLPASVVNAQQTFFSGHAALAFAGMLYLTLFLRRAARVPAWDVISPASVLTGAPLVLATCVARARARMSACSWRALPHPSGGAGACANGGAGVTVAGARRGRYVSLTRVFDRRHRTEDICFGAIVGCIAAALGWLHQAARPNRLSVLAPLEAPPAAPRGTLELPVAPARTVAV